MSNNDDTLGGLVSFMPKSPDNFLSSDKHSYFDYQAGYNSADRSFHSGDWGLLALAVTTSCAAWWSTAAMTVMKSKITVMLPSIAIQPTGTPTPCWLLVFGRQPTCTS
ncbi:MAG: hypothetical protein ACR5LD_05980 [Symbiopectobacterium sp.]